MKTESEVKGSDCLSGALPGEGEKGLFLAGDRRFTAKPQNANKMDCQHGTCDDAQHVLISYNTLF